MKPDITNTTVHHVDKREVAVEKQKAHKKATKKFKKLCAKPEARLVTVTADGNLSIKAQNELIVEHYILVSWRGLFAKSNGVLWQPGGQDVQLPIEIGLLTESNCYLKVTAEDVQGLFLDEKNATPESEVPVLIFTWTDKFSEAFIITPSMTKKPLRLLRPMKEGSLLRALILDLMKAYQPGAFEDLSQFLKEVEHYG